MDKRMLSAVLATGAAALAVCFWERDALPAPERLNPGLFAEPLQTPTARSPFAVRVGDITYKVTPLFEYDLYGLVVSEHDTRDFIDTVHREAWDRLNVIDLCVVWKDDARLGAYRDMKFSSGQFTCYFESRNPQAATKFDIYQISNNHLLTEDPVLAAVLRGVHVGDEVHFHGYLAEYEHDHGFHFHRGTSTTRFDTGPGACETVYVTDASVLASHDRPWRAGAWVSGAVLLAGALAWVRQPLPRLD